MKTTYFMLFSVIFLCAIVSHGNAYDYHWEIDKTPEGQDSATIVKPVQVKILEEQVEIPPHSASIQLMKKYSVHLTPEWSRGHAYRLLETFESIPQLANHLGDAEPSVPASMWMLSDQHIQDDINIEYHGEVRIVTIATDAFMHATPLLAEIEGVRGRYFSKRLHHAVVRFVTDNGADRLSIFHILRKRFAVSIEVPDYVELTKHTTREHAGRFTEFKNKELIAIISMFEEMPSGMHKIQGLKYLVRRLDGTPNPFYPEAAAIAWTGAGYIEFMDVAFEKGNLDYTHRLIIHEKAHFLWAYLFDEQLKQDWIELGGWYENPDDKDGWLTTKQTEFVSAYAHAVNPNEDMAESISFYIIRPDKLRSRSPAKYEFIQNRIMHGTRYISKIREDLTFEVYNLYPDYIYPGRIVRLDIQVTGEPEEDKWITVEIEIHSESELDTAYRAYTRVFNEKGTYFDLKFFPVDDSGNHAVDESGNFITAGRILRTHSFRLSKFAANGYWTPDNIRLTDVHKNERYNGLADFGWKLYIDNPLADCSPPEYVSNSMKLSLSQADEDGRPYQIVKARWKYTEDTVMSIVCANLNDAYRETYSRYDYSLGDGSGYDNTGIASVDLKIADYMPSGTYELNRICMGDVAGNGTNVYFTRPDYKVDGIILNDEPPATIDIQTENPDLIPPVLDLNSITINAEPTRPEDPNGETHVYITFKIKDNISGYSNSDIFLRDPQGVMHGFGHVISNEDYFRLYFRGDPTIFQTYEKTILLPVGSVPGTWGLAQMVVVDKASNRITSDFTEIIRFEVEDASVYAKSDVNEDGEINILDLVLVAAFDASNERADVNGDGTVNILDLVEVASHLAEEDVAAPAVYSATADQIESWVAQTMQADNGSPAFHRGIQILQSLLLKMRPATTVLLPNYPNPFNPETWIPYHLANGSDVQITIYDMKGTTVRTLALGHQSAGYYINRSRAAYWDGRNSVGERIASGVYFYRLQADSISQLRKMVILK